MAGDSGDIQYEGTKVGVVTHYFDQIQVAAITAEQPIKVGDTIKIYDKEGNVVVEQVVASMQVDKQDLQEVEAGAEFGMKVDGPVKEGYLVYRQ